MPLELRIDNMFIEGPGLSPEEWDELASSRFERVHRATQKQRSAGRLGFYQLPDEQELVDTIRKFAEGAGQAFENVVVLGIGGSALGTIALRSALLGPWWNELDSEAREYYPRLYVLDNVDPDSLGPFLRRTDLTRTLFNVVSKSGGTAETAAQFLIVRARLEAELGDGYRRHLVFTTDPHDGVLQAIANQEGIAALPIPQNVGGRFSVLSAVGLLPGALVGIDIAELLAGARAMRERCQTPVLADNPAGILAAALYLADTRHAARIHVMMPYSDRLRDTADWFRQLWAESLGKRSGNGEPAVGPTPVAALGATDQHSQLQLYAEGPFDKVIAFLTVQQSEEDLEIPDLPGERLPISYLAGHTLGELLRTEAEATQEALKRARRPNLAIDFPRLGAHALGEFFMLCQIATVYAGGLYGVNPLDQPGVELSKRLVRERLGGA